MTVGAGSSGLCHVALTELLVRFVLHCGKIQKGPDSSDSLRMHEVRGRSPEGRTNDSEALILGPWSRCMLRAGWAPMGGTR